MDDIRVLIIAGSESDMPKMDECRAMLEFLGISNATVVASAHRAPAKVSKSLKEAEEAGAEVVIAAAGMSAALPGVVASQTNLPVIGVPLEGGFPCGLDALLSIVQMPTGIPVASVAVGAAKNAAVLAARILALKHPDINDNLAAYRDKLAEG